MIANFNVNLWICSQLVITGQGVRINGDTPSTGRVEVFYNGQWGTVCDDKWDINDAHVVCKQLGFSKAAQAYSGATHGQGSGPVWISDLECSGSESNLFGCRHSGCGNNHCTHSGDASVRCSYSSSTIRLMGGGRNYGRVEIYDHGVWGTVCDDSWDMTDANVACRELGYSGATSAPQSAAYGQGTGNILRDHIDCQGSETSLLNCPADKVVPGHCSHAEDSGVVCY